jgi:hypothetical protein
MRLPTGRQGMQPPAQRALWLGEIAGCGVNKKKNE